MTAHRWTHCRSRRDRRADQRGGGNAHRPTFGVVVRSVGFSRNLVGGIKSFKRGDITEYSGTLEEARGTPSTGWSSTPRPRRRRVVAVRFDSSDVGDGLVEVVAYGTPSGSERSVVQRAASSTNSAVVVSATISPMSSTGRCSSFVNRTHDFPMSSRLPVARYRSLNRSSWSGSAYTPVR